MCECVCMHVYARECVYKKKSDLCTHTCIMIKRILPHMCVRVYVSVRVCVCMRVCVCGCVQIHTHHSVL